MNFKLISRKNIDVIKYNKCINASSDTILYGEIWYLDIVTEKQWNLIVWGDYNAVLPLPISNKYFLRFLQNPFLCQQLDIYKTQEININYQELLKFLEKRYNYIALSTTTKLSSDSQEKINCLLETDSYLTTKPQSTRRSNLKKALNNELKIHESEDLDLFFDFFKSHFYLTGVHFKNKTWVNIKNVLFALLKTEKLQFNFASNSLGELVSVATWLIHKDTAYYFYAISNIEGRKTGAAHLIIDTFIRKNKTVKNIDFEGSSIEGVKRFYKTFGAKETVYFNYSANKLPFPLNKLKK